MEFIRKQIMEEADEEKKSISTVSYTHLDVYKRQVKMNVIIIDILSSIGIAILAIAMKTYGMKEINMDLSLIHI